MLRELHQPVAETFIVLRQVILLIAIILGFIDQCGFTFCSIVIGFVIFDFGSAA